MTYIVLFGQVKFSPAVFKHGHMVGALTERHLDTTEPITCGPKPI